MTTSPMPGAALKRVSAPEETAVPTDAVKANARVDFVDHDAMIERNIRAATGLVERRIGRRLITQTWRLTRERLVSNAPIWLPLAPVQSIEAVTYRDSDEVEQAASVDDFDLFSGDDDAVMRPISGTSWPAMYDRPDALSVTFTAGYGDTSDDVPEDLQHAVILLATHFYANPQAVIVGSITKEIELSISALLEPFRRGWAA